MNITIYIRKDLEDLFKAEKEKSKLVNRLLDEYYSSGLKLRDKPLWPEETISEKNKSVATATRVEAFTKLKDTLGVKLCKIHGTPLDDRNRCLTKGCRYA
jgi:hypothetical protein